MTTQSPTLPIVQIAVNSASRAFAQVTSRITNAWRRHQQYKRSVIEMEACSDRVLRDLGIYRGDIERIARDAYYDI